MSDKPREFWFSRKRVEIGASPVQTDYYNTRFYPQEEFERERSRNVKLREALEDHQVDIHDGDCLLMITNEPKNFECSCNYQWINDALTTYRGQEGDR
jgi:hypothetical protein